MALGQVNNVDVVAHACAVQCLVVAAEDVQVRKVTVDHAHYVRHQVVWDVVWTLSNESALMCSNWVEVPKRDDTPLLLAGCPVLHDLFNHGLGLSVGVDWLYLVGLSAERVLPVDAGTRGEDEAVNLVLVNQLQQVDGATHVVLVVLKRLGHRLTHCFVGRKMDATRDGVTLEDKLL